jgi:hypothetical protein
MDPKNMEIRGWKNARDVNPCMQDGLDDNSLQVLGRFPQKRLMPPTTLAGSISFRRKTPGSATD